jgi:mono/diheme cytochrome c family protein
LIHVVENGLQASAMPFWSDVLSAEEISAVVSYIQGFSEGFDEAPQDSLAAPPRVPPDQASIERGASLFAEHCTSCHGADGRRRLTLVDSKGYPVISRDLTAPWSFRGGSEPEEIWLRITTGLLPSPMFAFDTLLTDEERWDVVNYLLSIARVPPWQSGGVLDGPGHQADLLKRGEYLTHLEMCGLCHTQINPEMIYSGDQYYLAGGMGIPAYPQGTFVSRNLTPDERSGLGRWTVQEIADAIRNGKSKERYLNLWGMPWMFFHSLQQEDALAIATYLKSRPPVTNRIPLPLKYGFVETVIAKSLYSSGFPPIAGPDKLIYKSGNYGRATRGVLPRAWPQPLMIGLQWLVIVIGVVAYVVVTLHKRAWPRGRRGRLRLLLSLVAFSLLGFLLWVIYSTPVLPFIPPVQINRAVTTDIHDAKAGNFATPEQAALAGRGEYLFTVTSCAFCHGADGSGGAKISMKSFGTLWTRNITSDVTTGIGAWSDQEISRAIRSGVAKGGRALHWQGMIWDHLSNLDEEDVAALLVYLRTLPPVTNEVPTPVPPAANDCDEYTFFLVDSRTPGCTP